MSHFSEREKSFLLLSVVIFQPLRNRSTNAQRLKENGVCRKETFSSRVKRFIAAHCIRNALREEERAALVRRLARKICAALTMYCSDNCAKQSEQYLIMFIYFKKENQLITYTYVGYFVSFF